MKEDELPAESQPVEQEVQPIPGEGEAPAPAPEPQGAHAEGEPPAPAPTGIDRLRSLYPEYSGDDDSFYGGAAEELDGHRQWRKEREDGDKKVGDLLRSNPKIAQVLHLMMQGASDVEALSRVFSPEDLERYEGEPDYEAWKKGSDARLADLRSSDERSKSVEANSNASKAIIDTYAKEKGKSEQEMGSLLDTIFQHFDDLSEGKITPDLLALFDKGSTYDKDVADAAAQGEVAGRNAKIEKSRKDTATDGLPAIDGGGGAVEIQSVKFEKPNFKSPNQALDDFVKSQKK